MSAIRSIRLAIFLFVLACVSMQSQVAVNLRGKVTTTAGFAISSAEVTLVSRHPKDTTDSMGNFEITSISTSLFPAQRNESQREMPIYTSGYQNTLTEFRFEPSAWFDLRGRILEGNRFRDRCDGWL
jgi:hypothetical protein